MLQAAGVSLLCMVGDLRPKQGIRRLAHSGESGPELPGSYLLCWFLSIFSGLLHESSFPHLRQTPMFLLIFLPLLYLLTQTQWHVLENLKGTLSWCTQMQPCFTYQMLISQMNFSGESPNQIFLCCSPLLSCSPVVVVLRRSRIQKP